MKASSAVAQAYAPLHLPSNDIMPSVLPHGRPTMLTEDIAALQMEHIKTTYGPAFAQHIAAQQRLKGAQSSGVSMQGRKKIQQKARMRALLQNNATSAPVNERFKNVTAVEYGAAGGGRGGGGGGSRGATRSAGSSPSKNRGTAGTTTPGKNGNSPTKKPNNGGDYGDYGAATSGASRGIKHPLSVLTRLWQ